MMEYLRKSLLVLLLVGFCVACRHSKNTSNNTKEEDKKESGRKTKNSPSESKKADVIIKEARSYSGTPYKYGGTSRAGMDCSGLTSLSYKAGGVVIPRTAGDQSTAGKEVALSELKKGDLIFFTDKKGHKKITHVGMVTEVKSKDSVKFIHASTKLGVVETELFSDYYKPLILKAVRVL